MDSHLAQIRTGEGKSVTLGALATFYALLGYDVDVICYSNFLSVRDYNGFKDIFEVFQVSSFITYGTFEGLADRLGDPGGQTATLAVTVSVIVSMAVTVVILGSETIAVVWTCL